MKTKAVHLFLLATVIALNVSSGVALDGSHDATPKPPLKIEEIEGVGGAGLYLDGRVYIAGQPSAEAFAELHRQGLAVVVNTRTPEEMEDRERVPFDEQGAVVDLGMIYVTIPLGGDDHPYGPDAVQQLAEALESTDGPVLIHCGYGSRAAYLWLAYLVEREGIPLESALSRGEAMMLKPHPVGRLLGRPTTLVFTADSVVQ